MMTPPSYVTAMIVVCKKCDKEAQDGRERLEMPSVATCFVHTWYQVHDNFEP